MTFSTHEIDDKCRTYRVLVKNPQENEHLEAVSIGERISMKCWPILRKEDWIYLVHDRFQWRVVESEAHNICVP